MGKTLVDYVWQTGAPLLATAEQLERLVAEQHLQPVGVLALDWLGVPLKWQDKTIGVMVVQTYTAGERLTEEHQQLLDVRVDAGRHGDPAQARGADAAVDLSHF